MNPIRVRLQRGWSGGDEKMRTVVLVSVQNYDGDEKVRISVEMSAENCGAEER